MSSSSAFGLAAGGGMLLLLPAVSHTQHIVTLYTSCMHVNATAGQLPMKGEHNVKVFKGAMAAAQQ